MKKILIYSVCEDFSSLSYAKENIEQGNEVYLIECDKKQGNCQHNCYGSRISCSFCYHSMIGAIRRAGLIGKVHLFRLSEVIKQEDEKAADTFSINFNSVQELKELTYKGAEVGFGAFSSYVTFSCNVMPEMTDDFKKYICGLIKTEVMIYEALERMHKEIQFDQIVFHNGRFSQFKPFLEFARLHNIDYIATEVRIRDGKLMKNDFHNDIPHSISYIAKKVLKNWDEADPVQREKIGRSFFERRKKGLAAGDKVYTKDQHVGELPEGWSDEVENIAIFNSSEDEFCSISKEYDSYMLFPNQFEALKTIFEHYEDDKTKHFYLRIHPNLARVPYKSHMALYELKYDNVTIIPATSTISSYALLDKSDKIIIFNSTMGVEATYWGKPVISLTKYVYWELGLLHHPEKCNELWEMIDDKELKVATNDNIIKYGYWLLHPNCPEEKMISYKYVDKILGHKIMKPTIMKTFGSFKFYILVKKVLDKLRLYRAFDKFPSIAPYNVK